MLTIASNEIPLHPTFVTRLRPGKIEDRIVGWKISQVVNYRIINDRNRGDIDLCRFIVGYVP